MAPWGGLSAEIAVWRWSGSKRCTCDFIQIEFDTGRRSSLLLFSLARIQKAFLWWPSRVITAWFTFQTLQCGVGDESLSADLINRSKVTKVCFIGWERMKDIVTGNTSLETGYEKPSPPIGAGERFTLWMSSQKASTYTWSEPVRVSASSLSWLASLTGTQSVPRRGTWLLVRSS